MYLHNCGKSLIFFLAYYLHIQKIISLIVKDWSRKEGQVCGDNLI